MTNLPNIINPVFLGAGISGLLFIFFIVIIVAIIIFILVFLYKAFAWFTIAKKLNYKQAWLAWIPIANFFLLPILASKNWAWGLISFIPIILLPLTIIPLVGSFFLTLSGLFILGMRIYWTWLIFEKRNYQGWFSLFQAIPLIGDLTHLIILGVVAWKDKVVKKPINNISTKKSKNSKKSKNTIKPKKK